MLVERKRLQDVPKGAVILSEKEVLAYYDSHIFGTSHTKDVWFLRHGFIIAGATAFVTNFTLLDYYRKRCKITGFMPAILSNLVFVAMPTVFAVAYHYTECRDRILLHNLCTSCLIGRAALIQNLFGMAYPLIPSAMGMFVYANLAHTYPMPGFVSASEIKESFEIWKKFTKRKIPTICLLFVATTATIVFVTKKELEEKDRLDEILKEQQAKLKAVAAEYQKKE